MHARAPEPFESYGAADTSVGLYINIYLVHSQELLMRFQMSHRSRNTGLSWSTDAPWDACTCSRAFRIIWCCRYFRGIIYQYLLGPFSGATHALSNEPSLAKYRLELVDLRTVGCMHVLQSLSNHMVLQILPWDYISISTWSILRSYSCAFK